MRIPKLKTLTPVLIKWKDATADNAGWRDEIDVDTELHEVDVLGFFFDQNEEAITLVQAYFKTEGDFLYSGSFVIPKKNIIDIKIFKSG